MAFDTTAADAILKELYGPAIVNELNDSVPFLKLIEKDAGTIPFSGREWVVPIHVGRNNGMGAVPQGGTLPTPGNQKYVDYKLTYAQNYGSIKVTGQAIEQTKNDRGAFGRAITSEMDGLRKNFRTILNRQFLGDGTGVLASVASWASQTATLSVPVTYDVLNPDWLVDVYDSTLTTQKASGVTVTFPAGGFDPSTWTVTKVTLGGTVTSPAANDVIVFKGNLNAEIVGLNKIVGAGVHGGIDPATYPVWQSPVLGNSGNLRSINEGLWQQAVDVGSIASGQEPKYWFTRPEIRRQYYLFKSAQNRNINTKKYDGGFDAIEFDGKEIFNDRMAPANKLFGINPDYLYILETQPPSWIDTDGRILYRDPNRTHSFLADMFYFCNLGCTMRNAQVVVTDLQM
ncbi:hypothetical protein SD70_27200 [Gordoniibacillus kamchatkensis]|uniref:Capsid protein n=1 Tax=Gordoniibacillus kamchatkensis TaxID=1590651 RepID=A0ABR5ACI2_9BACL|nr:phage major capsid protein [Paenibacillus sp. VKM B-2647]KIL38305.1 hypothetical protein SD70_27200 [Paenibacillus sp. VKM B-2647]